MLDETARSQLKRSYEQPDKVYALRQTGTLSRLLGQKDPREGHEDQTLEDTLSPSLFPKETGPIVFPFLLGESKSASSAGSIQCINRQIALMVEKMLRIQDGLRTAAGSASNWIAGPLVWCFLHRGSSWRLSAGYMPEGKKVTTIVS